MPLRDPTLMLRLRVNLALELAHELLDHLMNEKLEGRK